MLSNPTNNLHQRQRQNRRQHRRQQSTPSTFDATKVPTLPTIQRNASHRRGMSLDQRRRQSPPQDKNRVSTTNHGFYDTQQHILREAQQQRLARPGQQQFQYFNSPNDENYLISPIVSPHRQDFDNGCYGQYGGPSEQSPYPPFSGHINMISGVNTIDCSGMDQYGGNNGLPYLDSGNITPSVYLDFSSAFDDVTGQQDWGATIKPSSRPSSSRRVSGGIAERVAKFEGMTSEKSVSRPITPPNQNATNYFLPTPAQTPYNHTAKMEPGPQRFHDNYDTSMEETIKPTPRRSQRSKSTFQEMREQAEINAPLSPPSSCPVPASGSFDSAQMPASSSSFLSLSNVNLEYKSDHEYRSPYHSPTHSNVSQFSQPSSPEMSQASQAPLFKNADQFESKPTLEGAASSSSYPAPPSSPPSQTQPTSSQQSSPGGRASSVDSINLEETITDTGITIDDIACYIEGPHPIDQKWDCLYPDCKKRFGRKENIKSHVQTHLGDRQFQCPHCHKCFVRQHDLKRHAKIHSGVKPYPCLCGNSFARHDALTRHRQRGMCIGAFEGVVKKVVKRGRPRKNRPDTVERLEKSSRTRSKNCKAMSSASSTSGYSESSYGLSPPADFDILDQQPFVEFTANDVFSQNSTMMASDSFRFSPPPDIQGTCVSPQAIQNAPSPTYSSHTRNNSIASIPSHHLPSTPARSPISTHTPPELCQSSSSPPASVSFYDLQSTNDSLLQDEADKMFLDAFGDNSALDMSMRGLDQDSDLLSLMGNGKFDDSYSGVIGQAEADALFGDGAADDAFFGSP